ncbi:MAG: ATP-binding protein [Cyanobacteria bacterium P01_A01_bin.40]
MSEEQFSILLIDDDEVDRLTVKRAFKKANFPASLIEAINGEDAISKLLLPTPNSAAKFDQQKVAGAKFQEANNNPVKFLETNYHNFDLVLLDYHLPDIDGLNLIAEIKALNLDLPLIVLTGQGDEELAVEMMKAGAADYISKGKIEPHSLTKAISGAIRIHQAEKAVAAANLRLRASNELLVLKNQELERQQQQIKLQNIKLQESYNLKSEFLATMSHELRTPMNAIMGFSQLLLRQYPDPLSSQQENLIQRIFNNSQNLLTMINEMLDFSKIEAGRLEVNPQEFDLNFLIKLTVEELRSLALQKQLSLVTKIELDNNFLVQDSNFVKRTLINLLSNAIKFTDSGGVEVKAWSIDEATIAIAVTDSGSGISSEDRVKIFQAFRQGDQTFTRQHSGTGLGLAITESLVKMMGGKISLASEIGQGSTFTVEIPRRYDT